MSSWRQDDRSAAKTALSGLTTTRILGGNYRASGQLNCKTEAPLQALERSDSCARQLVPLITRPVKQGLVRFQFGGLCSHAKDSQGTSRQSSCTAPPLNERGRSHVLFLKQSVRRDTLRHTDWARENTARRPTESELPE